MRRGSRARRIGLLGRAAVFLGQFAFLSGTGLAMADPAPVLFLVDSQFAGLLSTIYTLDPATGALTLRANLGTDFTPIFGLAAADGSLLYLTGTDNGPADLCQGTVACLLIRVVLDPASATPSEITVVGPLVDSTGLVTGITGLNFSRDGVLYASSQNTDNLYTVDPATGTATLVGGANLDLHGGDITFDGDDRL